MADGALAAGGVASLNLSICRRRSPEGPKAAQIVTPEINFNNWWRVAAKDPDAVRHLRPALSARKLNLNWSNLGDDGVALLCRSSTLTDLQLASNLITDQGALLLAANTNLVKLDLHAQYPPGITDLGVEALSKSTSLTSLDVCENFLTEASVRFFLHNSTLTSLKLNGACFRFWHGEESDRLEAHLARNESRLLARRKTLLLFLITVARQRRQLSSSTSDTTAESLLSRLPPDLVLHMLRFFRYPDYGKTTQQLQSVAHFIFTKFAWVNRRIETKRPLKFHERPNAPPLDVPCKMQLLSVYLEG